jgi:DNA modification methylase
MKTVPSGSVALVVTSPPYPMIKMWDELFAAQNPDISEALEKCQGLVAFELMHKLLDAVWDEVNRVLTKGGIACINIGDAVRSINNNFSLYQNHTRVMSHLLKLGFNALPAVLWRKQTNAPNKFMGSGMLPPTAYVTLEHEYILIARKGEKREFTTSDEKQNRRESAFFWEERNVWYSDIWEDVKGATQSLFDNKARDRSAAFPFAVPYRLINMFSVKGDTVLDPFLGIGTTIYAAAAAGRNSIGFEIDPDFQDLIFSKMNTIVDYANGCIDHRLERHMKFVDECYKRKKELKYVSKHYGFPVMTKQETKLLINPLTGIRGTGKGYFETTYAMEPKKHVAGAGENRNIFDR